MSARSTTRIVAALPGAILIDKYGCEWFVGVNGTTAHHYPGDVCVWPRRAYPNAQAKYGPFRLREDLAKFRIGGWT